MRPNVLLRCVLLTLLAPAAWCDDPAQRSLTDLDLEDLMKIKVKSAALHDQSLADAPASVTVVTREDLWKTGCRSLADALAYVRGFFDTYDRTYHLPGVRGFAMPGDYGSRLLVLIDGNNQMSMVDGSNPFGQDLPVDVALIKQIEIVRGPSSALYGSNGVLATVNIITRQPDEAGPVHVRTELGSAGEKKAQVSAPLRLGENAGLLLSAALFNNTGDHRIDIPELNAFGPAVGMDGERGYQFFAKLKWKSWSLLAAASSRVKVQPVSWAQTIVFNDPGTRAIDSRGLFDAAYTHKWEDTTLEWHTYYDTTRFGWVYRTAEDGATGDDREYDAADWVGSRLSFRFSLPRAGDVTVGAEGRVELRTLMSSWTVQPEYSPSVKVDKPDVGAAFFVQDEIELSEAWKVNLGARFDVSRYRAGYFAPRAALIWQPSSSATYKFLYGRAFRNPVAYEMFYADGVGAIANPWLRAETDDTFEVVAERALRRRWKGSLSIYRYDMKNMIVADFDAASGFQQYRNAGRDRASGVELEVAGRAPGDVELLASMAFQRSIDSQTGYPLTNSPGQVGKLRATVPLLHNRISLLAGVHFLGPRQTLASRTLPWQAQPEVVISSARLSRTFDFQFGVRNLFNRVHYDPASLNPVVDAIRQPGRQFFVTLVAHRDE